MSPFATTCAAADSGCLVATSSSFTAAVSIITANLERFKLLH
ncbi:hypothetical protein [Rickettsia endosymbiont of Proechinophthirus fluctus]|nr:hypothetical protein [Rickettsia endosymbiont of Proechinophthirus fluctus]